MSTRAKNYIIDPLVPDIRKNCHLLNLVFADPSIVKVLHGAKSDVIWLQRDLGLYLVNLFDTGEASRALQYSSLSLAYLLDRFCPEVNVSKQYQRADWRVRPLTSEMKKYAVMDTHYLLYIYDRLRQELLLKGSEPMAAVLQNSADICLKTYEKKEFKADGYQNLISKHRLHLAQASTRRTPDPTPHPFSR